MPRRRRGMGGGGGLFGSKKKGSGGGGLFGGRKKAPAAPQRRTFGSSSGARKIPPRPVKKTAPPPATKTNAPAPARRQEGGGIMSGIASTVVQGMAFGTGSAIAHRAVGAVAGSMSGGDKEQAPQQQAVVSEETQQGASCDVQIGKFYDCLDEHDGNIGACQFFFDMMQQCQKDAKQQFA